MSKEKGSLLIWLPGLLGGLLANAISANSVLSLLDEPIGARIRPMGQAFMMFVGAFVGLCSGASSIDAIRQKGTRWVGLTGLFLGLSPLPLGILFTRYVTQLRHLEFLP
jgi:uncharacterized transporter YbjL